MRRLPRGPLAAAGFAVLAALLLISVNDRAQAVPGINDPTPGEIFQVAIDTDPTGNPTGTGGLLSSIDPCLPVSTVGTLFNIHVVVDEIDSGALGMSAFEFRLFYDPAIIELVTNNHSSFMLSGFDFRNHFRTPMVIGGQSSSNLSEGSAERAC